MDFHFRSALALARQIRARQLSAVELTTLYLERLDKIGRELGALVTLTPDLALAEARQCDAELAQDKIRSPLHGVPYGIKDLFATCGVRTTWGSPVYADRVIDHDAAVVVKLREAGCPLLGKLAMVEFAGSVGYGYANASLTGAGRNPWDPQHWAGGSSSGSGAAVGAGLVGFAIGTETWGSIVCPAAFCGITGLRPTAGRVSRDGAMALSWTMDKIGPMARTAADTAVILQCISGSGGRDLAMRPEREARYRARRRRPSVKGWRVGVVRPDYGKGPSVQADTDVMFRSALRVLEGLGVIVEDVVLPDLPIDEAAGKIVNVEAASAFEAVTRDPEHWKKVVDPKMRAGLMAGLVIPAVDYVRALRIRGLAQETVPALFGRCDALVAPAMLQVAPPVSANFDEYFTFSDGQLGGFGNMLGLPAITVPMGFGEGNLPLGLQFVGAPLAEDVLIALADVYQGATLWHEKHPLLEAHR